MNDDVERAWRNELVTPVATAKASAPAKPDYESLVHPELVRKARQYLRLVDSAGDYTRDGEWAVSVSLIVTREDTRMSITRLSGEAGRCIARRDDDDIDQWIAEALSRLRSSIDAHTKRINAYVEAVNEVESSR